MDLFCFDLWCTSVAAILDQKRQFSCKGVGGLTYANNRKPAKLVITFLKLFAIN